MSLPIKSTGNIGLDSPSKTLLYSHHGFGKTYQARHYQEAYGKGIIFSGEAGLKSLQDVDIDTFRSPRGKMPPAPKGWPLET